MSEWKDGILSDIAEIIMGQSPKGDTCNENGNGLPLLNGPTEFGADHPFPTQFTTDPRKFAKKGDVLFCVRGSTTGRMNWANQEYAIGRGIASIRAKSNNYNSFIYHLLKYRLPYLLGIATGSTFPNVSKDHINGLPIIIPDRINLEFINSLFFNLDQKITLLRQQNQTLEELAQTLFKRWFVEFEFPCLPSGYRPQGQVNLAEMAKVCTYSRVGGLPAPDGQSWFVYVLLCEDGSFYKGMTNDLYRRFYEHYTGNGAQHTKTHKPVKVIHWENFNTQDEARKREEELKSGYGRAWLQREYEKFLKYGHVASDGLPAQHEGNGLPAQNEGSGLPAHQTRLMLAGKMMESELGEIPEGWRVGHLSDIADLTIGRTPPRKESQWFSVDKKDIKWVSIKDLGNSGAFISNSSEYLTEDAVTKFRVPLIPENTTILSFKLTVGRVAITTERMASNEAIAHIHLHKDYNCFQFSYLLLKGYNYNRLGSTSSIATAVNSNSIKNMEIFIPRSDVVKRFDDYSLGIFNKIRNNTKQIQHLTELRDTLLPKLMSGEVRIIG